MNGQTREYQTIDLQRAKHAYEQIRKVKEDKSVNSEKKSADYVSYVNGLPAAILQNGLGQAMATLLAAAKGKTEDVHRLVYDHVEDWLCNANSLSPYAQNNTPKLMKQITEKDENAYLVAQAEALAYLSWLKKFAVAYLKDKSDSESEG